MGLLRWIVTLILATGVAFAVHVFYGRGWVEEWVQDAARQGRFDRILREPYPEWVVVIAALTALLPMAAKVLAFVWLRDRLPGRSGIAKGLWFALLLLAFEGQVVRMPLMAMVVGSPLDAMIVQNSEPVLIAIATGVLLGALTPRVDPNRVADCVGRVLGRRTTES